MPWRYKCLNALNYFLDSLFSFPVPSRSMSKDLPIDQDGEPIILTRKEREFLRIYLRNADPGAAALESGIARKGTDPHEAGLIGARLLERIQPQLRVLMAANGLSDQVLLRAILEGITATRIRVVVNKDTKEVSHVDTLMPDWNVRKFYHRLMAQMGFLIGVTGDQASKTQVDELAMRRQTRYAELRRKVSSMSDEEINQAIEEAARARQGSVRRAIS
jgi:predicted CopG family antitoxin